MRYLFFYLLLTAAPCIAQRDTTISLKTITVKAPKKLVERKTDRMVLYVDALLSATGTTGMEVLEQAPGVHIDNDNISLNGKQNPAIYINGKPSYLQGTDLANYLRALPAGQLDKIEIMTNPPARYEAAGNGGIINIQLKKGNLKGFNGNLDAQYTQGKYARTQQGISLNFRQRKLNIYGNLSNYNGTGMNKVITERYYPKDSLWQSAYSAPVTHRLLGKVGLDYYATNNTTISITMNTLYRDQAEQTSLYSMQADTVSSGYNQSSRIISNTNITAGLQHRFDSGRLLSVDVDYIRYHGNTYLFNNIPGDILQGRLPVNTQIYAFKGDYTRVWGVMRMEAGGKLTYMETNSSMAANEFHYRENIQAVYADVHTTFRQWAFQLGLRAEHTNRQQRTQLFPTAYISHTRGDHQWNLSFGKRIERPAYNLLDPFVLPRDKYTYQSGNPSLKPTLSYNSELAYTFRQLVTATLFYNHLQDVVLQTVEVHDNRFFYSVGNTGRQRIAGVSLNASLQGTSWWMINPDLLFTHTGFGHTQGNNWNLSATQQFRFLKGWSAEIITDYYSTQVFPQFIQSPSWNIHAGLAKKLYHDKMTISLNGRDLFYTRADKQVYRQLNGANGYTRRLWDTRNVTLALSYRFSKGAKAARSLRAKETGEESKRLGEP